MIPGMVNVLEQCIREEDEDNASKVFEVFNTLVVQVIQKEHLYMESEGIFINALLYIYRMPHC
jgi:hypothetical protein